MVTGTPAGKAAAGTRAGKSGGAARRLETREHEAYSLLQRAASELDQQVAEVVKRAGMTPAKFNVLRILRRAGGAGLACSDVSERLVRHDPDVTRLLDRLEDRGLVTRSRDAQDRRVVVARITEAGLRVLDQLDGPIRELHARQFGRLSRSERAQLVSLLERLRGGGE